MASVSRFFTAGALAGVVALAGLSAQAQDFPTRPIRFVLPITTGGSTDVLAREVAHKMREKLGQPVVVDNRPGAAGSIGTASVATAPPDGYTIVLVNASFAINPHVYKSVPFDALKDFAPVSLMTDVAMGVFVNPKVPANNLAEFIALLKANPEKYSFATSGNGGAGHVTGQLFLRQTGTKMVHVPYRGTGIAITDVLSGEVSVLVGDVALVANHVKTGALRALAVTTTKRSPLMPGTTTFEEAGIKGMDLAIWVGVLAPAKTPPAIVKKLSDTIATILKEPEMAEKVRGRGFNIVASTPEEFATVIKRDYDAFGQVVRESGIKAD